MNLEQALRQAEQQGRTSIKDGAETWDVWNLLDALKETGSGDLARDVVVEVGAGALLIYAVDSSGYKTGAALFRCYEG